LRGRSRRARSLLASDFAAKATPAVVEKERAKLAGLPRTHEKLESGMAEMC